MDASLKRMARERSTLAAMIRIFCRSQHHETTELCPQCKELESYAFARLGRCRFAEQKPTCAKCPVHCFKPEMRQRVREVMRFAGPRMLYNHPVLAVLHLLDGLRKPPVRTKKR